MASNPLRFSLFISSRNLDTTILDGKSGEPLTEIRLFLKEELERELFFGEKFLFVEVNETFGADGTEDSYAICLQRAKEADFVIALYSGEAGWAPDGNDIGICHAELEAAFQASPKKVAIIDISKFFNTPADKGEAGDRNANFKKYFQARNRFNNPLKVKKADLNNEGFKNTLLQSFKNILSRHFSDRVTYSNQYFSIGAATSESKDWKQLNYGPRANLMKATLEEFVQSDKDYDDIFCQVHSIPDRMSIPDAKAFTGRPYLHDQTLLEEHKFTSGPIHFIAVFTKATETQVKDIIGQPDISVISDDFGFYLWDQQIHIQMVVLTECGIKEAISAKFLLFQNWATNNNEVINIQNRAKARCTILNSINQASKIALGKK